MKPNVSLSDDAAKMAKLQQLKGAERFKFITKNLKSLRRYQATLSHRSRGAEVTVVRGVVCYSYPCGTTGKQTKPASPQPSHSSPVAGHRPAPHAKAAQALSTPADPAHLVKAPSPAAVTSPKPVASQMPSATALVVREDASPGRVVSLPDPKNRIKNAFARASATLKSLASLGVHALSPGSKNNTTHP